MHNSKFSEKSRELCNGDRDDDEDYYMHDDFIKISENDDDDDDDDDDGMHLSGGRRGEIASSQSNFESSGPACFRHLNLAQLNSTKFIQIFLFFLDILQIWIY